MNNFFCDTLVVCYMSKLQQIMSPPKENVADSLQKHIAKHQHYTTLIGCIHDRLTKYERRREILLYIDKLQFVVLNLVRRTCPSLFSKEKCNFNSPPIVCFINIYIYTGHCQFTCTYMHVGWVWGMGWAWRGDGRWGVTVSMVRLSLWLPRGHWLPHIWICACVSVCITCADGCTSK